LKIVVFRGRAGGKRQQKLKEALKLLSSEDRQEKKDNKKCRKP